MERKKKRKIKIKKRTKERKGSIPDQRSKGSEMGEGTMQWNAEFYKCRTCYRRQHLVW